MTQTPAVPQGFCMNAIPIEQVGNRTCHTDSIKRLPHDLS